MKDKILDDVVSSLRDLVCQKFDKECEKSRIGGDDGESLVVGVKTRGMLRRREEYEASIGKRDATISGERGVTMSKKKR